MPKRRPALVHDLGLPLGGKIIRLLADDRQNIGFPALQRRILEQELHDIALGFAREVLALRVLLSHLALLLLDIAGRVDILVYIVLRLELRDLAGARLLVILGLFGRLALDERAIIIDQIIQR